MKGQTHDIRAVIRGVDRFSGPAKSISRQIRGLGAAAGGLTRRFGGVAGALTGVGFAASAAGVLASIKSYASAGDELGKFSRQAGLTVEALQELKFAAERSGVSQGVFNSSLVALNKRLGELKAGSGSLKSFLDRASPALRDQLLAAKSTEEAFELLVAAMAKIEDPSKRNALAAAAFSRSGVAMTRMAENGVGGLRSLREEARRLGFVIDEEAAAEAERFQDDLTGLQRVLLGVRNVIGSALLPVIRPLIVSLTEWGIANREVIASGVVEFVQNLVAAGQGVGRFVEAIGGIENALIGVGAVLAGPVIAPIVSIGATLAGLFGGPVLLAILGVGAALTALALNWDKISGWITGKIEAVVAAFDQGFLQGVMEMFRRFSPVTLIREAIDGVVDYLFGVDLSAAGAGLLDTFRQGILSGVQPLLDTVDDVMGWARDFFPSSPARRGPFSDLDKTGPGLTETFADGIAADGITRRLQDALGAARANLAAPAAAGASSPAQVRVELIVTDDRIKARQVEGGAGVSLSIVGDRGASLAGAT